MPEEYKKSDSIGENEHVVEELGKDDPHLPVAVDLVVAFSKAEKDLRAVIYK